MANPFDSAWSLLKHYSRGIPYDLGNRGTNRGRKWRVQVPAVGGTEADIQQGLRPDALSPIPEDTSAMDALASGTRQDLINMVLASIQQMSDDDLLNLLQSTQGGLISTLGPPNMPPS